MDEFATILNRRLVRVRSEMTQNSSSQTTTTQSTTPNRTERAESPVHHYESNATTQPVYQRGRSFNHPLSEQTSAFNRTRTTSEPVHYQTPGVEGERERHFARQTHQE